MRYLRDAWLVILLSVAFGGALAGVQAWLNPRIEANKRAKINARIPELLLGREKAAEARERLRVEEVQVKGADGREQSVYRATLDGRLAGWAIVARGQGFADIIQILVGLDPQAATITGISILEQKETPGLGNKIEAEAFRNKFAGKQTGVPLERVKGQATRENQIEAVTGATVSSESVCGIINQALANAKGALAAQP